MKKPFTEILIRFNPFNPELISGFLELLDVQGIIEEEDNSLKANFKIFNETKLLNLKQFFENLKRELLIETYSFQIGEIENKNWNEEWEKSIQPIKVSERIVIKPSFKEYFPKENELVVTIDPKMSFGTGYHQTTRIMIRLLEKFISKGSSVLDLGTGTGVLGIIASKLGSKEVIAVDNDIDCYENSIENFLRNDVRDKCRFILGEIKNVNQKEFDIILANINRNVLLEVAEELKSRLKPNGIIILSGLILEDEKIVVDSYTNLGFKLIEKQNEDECIGIVFGLN